MTKSISLTDKSLLERVSQALLFETLAIAICAPTLAWLMNKPLLSLGILTLMFASIAMLWNVIFNALFDRVQDSWGFERSLKVRVVHACLFELGLIVVLVPVAAWWLSIGLLEAFWLDIGLILFFLPYTMAFNWVYDTLRPYWHKPLASY